MSFVPTGFRPQARGGFGGRAASHFRGLLCSCVGQVQGQARGQSRGQVGTVVYRSPGGFCNTALTGISRDSTGAALGACRVELWQGNVIKDGVLSDAAGAFTFLNPGSGPFYIIAYKAGSPDVAGTTINTLQPVVV